MKILLVGDFSFHALDLSYSRAFKEKGLEVSEFDYKVEYDAINSFSKHRYLNKLLESYFYRTLNVRLLETVKLVKPALICVFKGRFVLPETLREIKRLSGAIIFNFNPDNPFNRNRGVCNNHIRATIPFYDCYFIWGKFLISEIKNAGAKRVEYLPFAHDPGLHSVTEISDKEKKIYGSDVAFIGTWEKEREKWLENVADYDLAIWGNLWDRLRKGSPLKKKWKGKVAIGNDFSKVCKASKITLNFIRSQNGDAHNMRTFEVPACQGFMLTTRTKEQCEFFDEGSEMACFETPDELRLKVDQYLSNEEQRAKCALAAYQKVQPHTYSVRARNILDLYLKMRGAQ